MSNPNYVPYQLVAASSNGVALSQAVAGAGLLTLNGGLVTGGVATLDSGGASRRVLVASSGSDAAVVFTITGTSRSGVVQSSTVTGVTSTSSQYTALDFLTVTSVRSSGATAGNITVGTNGVGSSEWQMADFLARVWMLNGACAGPSGTTYSIEHTYDDPNALVNSGVVGMEQFAVGAGSSVPPVVFPNSTANNVSGNTEWSYANQLIFAWRLTILSGTGQVMAKALQAAVGSGM